MPKFYLDKFSNSIWKWPSRLGNKLFIYLGYYFLEIHWRGWQ